MKEKAMNIRASAELIRRLKEVAAAEGASGYTTLVHTWADRLSRALLADRTAARRLLLELQELADGYRVEPQ